MLSRSLIALLRIRTPLALVAVALILGGCVSSGTATKADEDEKNPFASYPVADIIEAGNKALDAGETERAVYIYMQALEIEQSAETWYRIGVGKARLGDKGYAWQAFKKAIELDPNHVGAQEELGLTYMAMAQPKPAEEHLKKATELDPMRWRAWNALGVLADMDKRYAAAVDYYHAGLIAAPQSPMLMTNIGYSYYLAGNLQEAGAWFGRALIAEENYPPAVKNLALLYARQGWYDQAVKTFSRVISKPQAYNDVGYVAMRQGDYEEAHELLTEAIRLSPTYYEKAYQNLEQVKKQLAGQGTPANAALRSSSAQIVVAEGEAPRRASVTAELLNVRSSPEADADIVTHLKAGDKVDIIMTMPDWAFVNYQPSANDPGQTGWVNSRYVGAQETQSTLAAEPEAPQETTVVTAATAVVPESAVLQTEQSSPEEMPIVLEPEVQEVAVVVTSVPEPTIVPETTILPATDAPTTTPTTDTTVIGETETTNVAVETAAVSAALPAAVVFPLEAPITIDSVSETATANALPVAQPGAETSNRELAEAITRKVEAVCEPGTQTEKTPQGAGSCIGVASVSADN